MVARSFPLPRLRRSAAVAAIAGGALALPAAADAARGSGVPANALRIERPLCTNSGSDPLQRTASFEVRLRDLSPASRSFGFAALLQERAMPGGKWTTLRGARSPAGFGRYQYARAGSTQMVRKISIADLRPGYRYRMQVRGRWNRGTGGRGTTVLSRSCAIADLRPDVGLAGGPIAWTPGTSANQVVYRVPVTASRLAALGDRPVTVELRQAGVVLTSTSYVPSAASEVLLVAGRRCAADRRLTVVVDPAGEIDERDETNNVRTVPCAPAS
ncbi:hypothetical protein [Patulibacter defluvii]|uniref:hypothetical protein n=1 Tax=Patulibacter defluvii TaxID=3095358 RepID=UPI002A74F82A|nr:hypothetical protein [Patulibacter sp. DM4]